MVDATTQANATGAISPTQQLLRRFLRHRLAVCGTLMLVIITAFSIIIPIFLQDPNRVDLRAVQKPPSSAHILGTDLSGRDVLARLITGTRTSLIVGFGGVAVYVSIGILVGTLAGFFGGALDQLLMRLTDTVLSIPTLLLVIIFVSVIGPSLASVIGVIGLLGWPQVARIVRGQLLSLRQAEFVTASRAAGAESWRILIRHLLPNIMGPISVASTFGVASSILLEAALSFLGLGVRAPNPSLGIMINEARAPSVLHDVPWLWLPPGIIIAITVLSVNFIGDGIRDALDPRSKRRVQL